ncbi:MAG: hypothetical protein FD124_1156 [Alphaproteobacteria bacterium]|nr:MAG: hypothetical protein FD160_1844 [Caulobacteraceae bacterium]TPW07404.1 MAG: hypothetical protein FD124_1156 [Alphaproteobacteria bacterium]
MTEISIARDFSRTPGGRFRRHGPFSGEDFRERHLEGALVAALKSGEPIVIQFDGVAGLPSSFLEEAFGGLVRRHPNESVVRLLQFSATERALLPYVALAKQYVQEAAVSA